jgi:glycosyltransferase involved in cell wall biosynthesis
MATSAPLRVAVVNPTGRIAGAETVLLRHVEAMVAEGWRVAGVSPAGPLADELRCRCHEVATIAELKLPRGPRAAAMARLATRWLSTVPALRRVTADVDVIVANSLLALPPLKLARLTTKTLWLVHEVIQRGDRRRIAAWSASGIAAAAAVSEAASVLPTSLHIDTTVVRNGVTWPIEPVDPNGLGNHPICADSRSERTDDLPDRMPSPQPIVGINATVSAWKGHDVLLEAIAGLPELDVEILGGHTPKDDAYVASLRRRATRPDLHGRVRFLGHHADPVEAMRPWSVAVNASVMPEAGPLAVLEAMSLGLPVVATNHGGTPEILGHAGLLVAPGDVGEMREAISELMVNPELRQRCHRAGRQIIANAMSTAISDEHFLDVVRAVGASSTPGVAG